MLAFLSPILLVAAPVFVMARAFFCEAFAALPEITSTRKFSKLLSLPKLFLPENFPRPRQMLAQMGHRTSLA